MKRLVAGSAATLAAGALCLAIATLRSLEPVPESLPPAVGESPGPIYTDREGVPLHVSYSQRWNTEHRTPLHDIPELLVAAFVESEDQRFFEHRGVDWAARGHALVENLSARRVVRGASTITEQAARLVTPRARTFWSRWVEGFEAGRLEKRFTKGEILEFYLNQVPYARQRRGVAQAALDYFDRDLTTLHPREMLALAILVRSPSRFDLRRSTEAIARRVDDLARRLAESGTIDAATLAAVERGALELRPPSLQTEAPHFVGHLKRLSLIEAGGRRSATTLSGGMQRHVTALLDRQVEQLGHLGVTDGAAVVIDHRSDEVLAWANAGGYSPDVAGSQIDAVLVRRQPGSTLKPFVYALALESGWTAATRIDDTPLARPVGSGLHQFRNYSRRHYGPVTLRQALGNSLNIPAVRAVRHVSPRSLLDLLHRLGFESLDRHPDLYGEGLALGNGEVTLLELTAAYATLARGGVRRDLRLLRDARPGAGVRVIDPEVSSIVSDILADPEARSLEFGRHGILALPVPTAVKTGTSTGYADAWALGFSDRFTVGVWLGNLDRREMDGVSGAIGPAPVLRATFAELRRRTGEHRLPATRSLRRIEVCRDSGALPTPSCPRIRELFREAHAPEDTCSLHSLARGHVTDRGAPGAPEFGSYRLTQPTPGLLLAMDPRIPDHLEAFSFRLNRPGGVSIDWIVDGDVIARRPGGDEFLWQLRPGAHTVLARVHTATGDIVETEPVAFEVR